MMAFVSRIGAPVVWVLDASTKALFRLFGQTMEAASAVTDEEKNLGGSQARRSRRARGQTPRTDVDWIDLDEPEFEIRETLINTMHSRLPVGQGDPDDMIGVLQARELLAPLLKGEAINIRAFIWTAPV